MTLKVGDFVRLTYFSPYQREQYWQGSVGVVVEIDAQWVFADLTTPAGIERSRCGFRAENYEVISSLNLEPYREYLR